MDDIRYSSSTLVTVVFVLGGFTLAVFILRMWFRITRRKFDASDSVLISAVICGIAQSIIYLVLTFGYSYGKLKKDIPLSIRTSKWPSKLLFMNQIVFKLTTPLCKLSLCLVYRTMCATSTGRLIDRTRIAIHCTIALIIGVYMSALLVSLFQCQPIHKTWSPKTPGTCVNLTHFRYSTAVFNILTSAMVITLPIPVLLKLKHHRPEIKQLIGLILLGLMHTSLTIARFVIMFYPDAYTVQEPQYGWIPGYTLAVGEMDANILFASLVVMRPAFQALYHALRPGKRGERKHVEGSSRADSVLDSAIGRFREAWERREKRNKKRASGTYILETTEGSVLASVDIKVASRVVLAERRGLDDVWEGGRMERGEIEREVDSEAIVICRKD